VRSALSILEVEAGLRALHEAGDVFEVRIPKAGRDRTVSGYFDDPARAAAEIAPYDGKAPGIYLTLNPVRPDLLARAHNRLRPHAEETSTDRDVSRRRWLLIDIDPVRPTGISATEEELAAAGETARKISAFLASWGWPRPLLTLSGNGAHLLYRIELANDEAARELVRRVLEALDARFSTEVVRVDTSVHNAARICKVPGTLAAKGDSTKERPHRRAHILEEPPTMEVVDQAKLAALAAQAPAKEPGSGSGGAFDLLEFLERHGLEVRREKSQSDRTLYELAACPFNPEHDRGEAYVGRLASGALFAGCQHASCTWGWRELRERLEPGSSGAGSTRESLVKKREAKTEPKARRVRVRRLSTVQPEEITWLWPGRLARGKLTIMAGDPGLGKSFATLDMAARISTGRSWPDGSSAPKGDVLLLSAEDGIGDTVVPRLRAMGADMERVHVLDCVLEGTDERERLFRLSTDLEALEEALEEVRPLLVVVDPLSAYLAGVDSHKSAEVRGALAPLMSLGERTGVAVLCNSHLTKGEGRNALYRVTGSLDFVAAARAAYLVAEDPDDEERRLILTAKMNIAQQPEGIAYRLIDGAVVWDPEPVTVSLADVLNPNREGRAKFEAAKTLLLDMLADGPTAESEIQARARQEDISATTLRRAKAALYVKSEKRGVLGGWHWSLPTGEESFEDGPTPTPQLVTTFDSSPVDSLEDAQDDGHLRRCSPSASLEMTTFLTSGAETLEGDQTPTPQLVTTFDSSPVDSFEDGQDDGHLRRWSPPASLEMSAFGAGSSETAAPDCRLVAHRRFWRRGTGSWRCAICHPPLVPETVQWLDLDEGQAS
jgi:RecA-family ATPase